ncbi:hypothetical protein C8Q80DRAFT_1347753, partial [Daedaleopsis nitida]
MSSLPDPNEVAELTALYNSLWIDSYCLLAGLTLFLYEFIILFGSEVEYFWRRRMTGASILFLLSRYLSLMYFILDLALYLPVYTDDHSCSFMQRVVEAVKLPQYFPWAAFAALRAYALSQSRVWMTIVFILSLAPIGVNATTNALARLAGIVDPVFGCEATISVVPTPTETAIEAIFSRGCLILADAILIVITFWSADVRGTLGGNGLSHIFKPRSLQTLLVRDGTVYFIVLLILNVLHLAFSLQATFGSVDGDGSYIVNFTEPCTAVLVNRFLLHLQEEGSRTVRVDTGDPLHMESRVSTLSFVDGRVLGSIGH